MYSADSYFIFFVLLHRLQVQHCHWQVLYPSQPPFRVHIRTFFKNAQILIVDPLPRQTYRIFKDAEESKQEIERMMRIISTRRAGNTGSCLPTTGTWESNILAQSTPRSYTVTYVNLLFVNPRSALDWSCICVFTEPINRL